MNNRTPWIPSVLLAVALIAVASTPVHAQRVLSWVGEWRSATPPPLFPDVREGYVYGVYKQEDYWDAWGVAQLGSQAWTTGGYFSLGAGCERDFTLAEPAYIAVPGSLTGNISFSLVEPDAGRAEAFAYCTIYDSAGMLISVVTNFLLQRYSIQGNLAVSRQTFPSTVKWSDRLPAGTYKLRTDLVVAAYCDPLRPEQTIGVDFCAGPTAWAPTGATFSMVALPAGLGCSRQAVRAPEARNLFGVDGTGIQVGLVEPGQPFEHFYLAGRVTVLPPASGGPGDYRDEHAMATAGIIAAAGPYDNNRGIAPGARILSAPTGPEVGGFQVAVDALLAADPNLKVISTSALYGEDSAFFISGVVNEHPNLTFVKSAGNAGTPGTITPPGRSPNIIAVGALNRDFTRRAGFSSFGGPGEAPMKPDLVAPGEYINATSSDGWQHAPFFQGRDFQGALVQAYGYSANTGDASGTSFAAPHVAGAAALLYQYQAEHPNHDADHRVIKAVLLNSASTAVSRADGYVWSQATIGTLPSLTVIRSLDAELGAGALDVLQALRQYEPDEIRTSDNNSSANFTLDAETLPIFWDLETVSADNGRVNYLLGEWGTRRLRTTLTWDEDASGGTGLMPLELRLYREGDEENLPGYDPANPGADLLIAATEGVGENVKLFDLFVPGPAGNQDYYLQVINSGARDTLFGIAVMPEPTALSLLALGGLALIRRRRAA